MMRTRRLYEEMRESLDRVARAVAHEVRNPVTAIGGLASRLLKKASPQSKEAQYLKRILESTTRLELIVSQVQLYAYLPQPYRRPLEMKKWLAHILEQYQDLARRQGVNIRLQAEDEELVVQLDPELMASALNNLIINALEAMPQGGELSVSVEAEPEALYITISDTGTGISPKDLPYLWDPFFTTKADRVGMSLAITKRIIYEHNGTLEVESTPGIYASRATLSDALDRLYQLEASPIVLSEDGTPAESFDFPGQPGRGAGEDSQGVSASFLRLFCSSTPATINSRPV